jgi:hypothetical protein
MGEATDARFACRSCDFVTNHTKASQDHRALTGHSVRWTGRPPTAADLVQDQADLLRPSDERGQALEDAARLVEARAVGAFTPSLWRDCAADIRAMATRPAPGASRPSAEPSEAAEALARLCEKCGSTDLWMRYAPAGLWHTVGGMTFADWPDPQCPEAEEHLHVGCRRCQHRWTEPTLAAVPPSPDATTDAK